MTIQFIRLDDTAIIINKIVKMKLDESRKSVDIFIEGKDEPFSFTDETPEQSISLYVNLSELLRQSTAIPFLFFSTLTIRLSILSAINLSGKEISILLTDQTPEIFNYKTTKEASDTFNILMKTQGLDRNTNPSIPAETSKAEVTISPGSPTKNGKAQLNFKKTKSKKK